MVYWVFGYGSLIFKPPRFAVESKLTLAGSGYVKGVVRRFAQSSIDHRGTPDAPGRVVTVIEAREWHKLEGLNTPKGTILPEDYVWGMAYKINPDYEEEVKAYMVLASELRVPLNATYQAEIWIGKLDNPAFVGHEPIDELAETIFQRHGPSGPNKEYLYKLAESVRHLYPHVRDDYLFGLEASVRALEVKN
ncbi:hypothetical protein L486_04253 [Kwoniella mangroviensis CBS 10435]|uniref:glutathione-specific gamma-glutamylcyclotransferase n=1 Tax=Kwoniella mangroviensis CBS 10435 TaxID=1331196 RepID=A0A1B9IRR0_9TREE|nr:uncharacterized protein I203_02654 [Kwoniella mangroviensis CBS 8507]OCF58223.1 hypothetical protein L486_04253 [Kwoniella mangroviensis CBS 10435]OCF67995.1 hypothetical protein I203_02654 [Kwoniella mangroviensis CBS 8507]